MEVVWLFDLPVTIAEKQELLDLLIQRISDGTKTFVVTANASIMVKAFEDDLYRKAVQKADLIFPDGIGVVWAIKKIHKKNSQRITGIDTMIELCKIAEQRKWKVFLLGARPEVVAKAAENLNKRFNNIICGYHHGYFVDNEPLKVINSSGANLIFVGMGVPKQELWISENFSKINAVYAMGVGGSFDVISGFKKRAPRFIQKLHLEWLYRFLQSPLDKKNVPKDVLKFIKIVLSNH
ncbi:WecB/TagA/CpsF family glycosyltransferase [Thermotoga profunda]|uniref:WecB/TagA/CpsF family glycosyltransferase n=1 Tax=Thermotoga profunda TaxID=1508420 RepID=UPI000596DA6C|nr:WecB/TagA/CpsF family glycosyltransferase [Thermotoga profunda]